MPVALYITAGIVTASTLLYILSVGKPRKVITPADAVTVLILNTAFIAMLVIAALNWKP